jgi:hypothetical protein
MAKRKRSKKEIREDARRRVENDPGARELRRRIEMIEAELKARREPGTPQAS